MSRNNFSKDAKVIASFARLILFSMQTHTMDERERDRESGSWSGSGREPADAREKKLQQQK